MCGDVTGERGRNGEGEEKKQVREEKNKNKASNSGHTAFEVLVGHLEEDITLTVMGEFRGSSRKPRGLSGDERLERFKLAETEQTESVCHLQSL